MSISSHRLTQCLTAWQLNNNESTSCVMEVEVKKWAMQAS